MSADVTNPETPERTRRGLAGKIAGRVKEAGSAVGQRDLAREGRLQQAQVEAEAERVAAAQEAARLELAANAARANADAIDPEER